MKEVFECTLCGRLATTDIDGNPPESWFPYAFLGEKEVSPVCPNHKGHWNSEDNIWDVEQV